MWANCSIWLPEKADGAFKSMGGNNSALSFNQQSELTASTLFFSFSDVSKIISQGLKASFIPISVLTFFYYAY